MVTGDSGNDPLRSMRPMKWPTRLRGRPRIASLLAVGYCILTWTAQARGDDPPKPDTHGENAVAFAPSGEWLVTGGSDGNLRIRDGTTGAVLDTLAGHEAEVRAVAVSPDGRTIASASNDCSARLWDVERRTVRRVLQTPKPPRGQLRSCFLAVAFAPDGRTVATGDDGGASRRLAARVYKGKYDNVITGDSGGTIRLWDVETGELKESWVADPNSVDQVLYSPDGSTIASVGDDPAVKLWDARSHAIRRTLPQPKVPRLYMAYSPDGATLAVSQEFSTKLWDPRNGVEKDHLSVCPAYAYAFTPDGDYLAVAGMFASRLWSVKARADGEDRWSVLYEIPDPCSCSALAVSPDGRWVAHCFSKFGTKNPNRSFKLIAIR